MCTVIRQFATPDLYWASRDRVDRLWFAGKIASTFPTAQSVCEIGAHCGPLMPALRKAFPTARLIAAEPSAGFVRAGQHYCEGLNVEWIQNCACQAPLIARADVFVFSHVISEVRAESTPDWQTVMRVAALAARLGLAWEEPISDKRNYRDECERIGLSAAIWPEAPGTPDPGANGLWQAGYGIWPHALRAA